MFKINEFIVNSLKNIEVTEDTLFDIVYDLYVIVSIAKGMDDVQNGRVISLEDFEQEMEELYANNIGKQSSN